MRKHCALMLMLLMCLCASCGGLGKPNLSKTVLGYEDVPQGFALMQDEQGSMAILGGLAGWGNEVTAGWVDWYMRLYSRQEQSLLLERIDNRLIRYADQSHAQQAFAALRNKDMQAAANFPDSVLGLGDEAYRTRRNIGGEGFQALTFRYNDVVGVVVIYSTDPAILDNAVGLTRLVLRRLGSRQ